MASQRARVSASADLRPSVPRTKLVGREQLLAELLEVFRSEPVVTLTGPGGAGKTRLAAAVVGCAGEIPVDEAFWVDLSGLSDESLVAETVATAVGARTRSRQPAIAAISDRLAQQQDLLALDNCEHLVTACADLVDAALAACPQLRVLCTSRRPLGVAGETLRPVPPLDVPPAAGASLAAVIESSAAQLFAHRARAVVPDFEITESNAVAVAQLCRRLSGLPLAVELAAARTRVLSVEQIVAGLDDMFHMLDDDLRPGAARLRTLRATLDWSSRLLSDAERTVFRRLAVFPGSFELSAAEAVASGADIPTSAVLNTLTRLVDQSLVTVRRSAHEVRYRLLAPVRAYAHEQLLDAGEWETAGRAHLVHYCALVEAAEPHLAGADQVRELDHLEREGNNLRAGLAFGRDHDIRTAARLAAALGQLCALRGHYTEGRQWLDWAATIDADVPELVRAKALRGSGLLALLECDYPPAVRRLEAGLQLYRAAGDELGAAGVLQVLGSVAREQGRYARAEALHGEGLSIYRAAGDGPGQARALNYLAFVQWLQGHWDAGISHANRALSLFRTLDDAEGLTWALINLGTVAQYQGQLGRADDLLQQAQRRAESAGFPEGIAWAQHERGLLALRRKDPEAAALLTAALAGHRSLGDRWRQASVLDDLAAAAVLSGDHRRAAVLLGAAAGLRDQIGTVIAPCEKTDHDQTEAACRAALGADRFATLWTAGNDARLDDALSGAAITGTEIGTETSAATSTRDDTVTVPAPSVEKPRTPERAPASAATREMASLRLRMLGAAEVYRDGVRLGAADWGYAKPRELMFLLASERGLTKERIGTALWPQLDGSSLRNAFHTALRDLRRALGDPAWIVYSGGRYAVDPSRGYRSDLDDFESALRSARESRTPADALPHLQRAIAVYGGDFLSGLPDAEWADHRGDELSRAFAAALAAAGRVLSSTGRRVEALELYRRAVEHDPLDETAHRRLMRCLTELGETAKAALVYHELETRLRDELGVAPAELTTAIYQRLTSARHA